MLPDNSTWSCTDSSDLPFPRASDSSAGLQTILNNAHPEAPAFPAKQGLYDPDNERDACGVGFVVHIKGKGNHKIVSDARSLLCNMTHRGASKSGSDPFGASRLNVPFFLHLDSRSRRS
jgi:hypothetical protein